MIIAIVIFTLWLYDTNRISLVAGVIRGKPSLVYPATGAEIQAGSAPVQTIPGTFHPANTPGNSPPALPSNSNPPNWLNDYFNNMLKNILNPTADNPG
jgi:hypothetical protein